MNNILKSFFITLFWYVVAVGFAAMIVWKPISAIILGFILIFIGLWGTIYSRLDEND